MKDILGRELHEGDVVVCKGSGSSYDGTPAKAMEIGIIRGEGVRTLTSWRNPRDKFLIEHPSKRDMQVIEQIKQKMRQSKQATLEKQKNRFKASEVGKVYKNSKGYFLYLGKGTVDITSRMWRVDWNTKREDIISSKNTYSGHIYLEIRNFSKEMNFEDIINKVFNVSYGYLNIGVLKSYKTVDKYICDIKDTRNHIEFSNKHFDAIIDIKG